jgi:endonuclease/exonuclease/phosphatase family metal-dependent hydrolase
MHRTGLLFVALAALSALLMPLSTAALPAAASSAPPVVDGRFDDWSDASLLFAAPATAGAPVEQVWLAADRDRLYLRLVLAREVVLQRDSGLVLYLDTDASAETGLPVETLGAEIRWSFGERKGRAVTMGLPLSLGPAAIGLRQAPTHAASEFELAIDRGARVAGAPIFAGEEVVLLLRDESRDAVTSTGPLAVRLADVEPTVVTDLSLARQDPAHLRILTYNVLFDGCFERPEPFRRIVRALDPDIVSLQEIFNHTAQQTRDLFASWLPGERWHAAGDDRGVIVSRFAIRDSGPIGARRRGGWALVAAPGGDVLVINPHPPCCDDDAGRQQEFDAIAAWLRDARASGRLPSATPIVIAGDMNLVGDARQLRTLLTGAIVDTATHGPSAPPDWDGTALADAWPYHLSGREVYTWRNDRGPFAPGRLDYLVYSDSVLGLGRRFVLWTGDLPDAFLDAHGLQRDDTGVASDHLPVVGDFYRLGASSR